MTLFRQIIISIVSFGVVIFIAIGILNFKTTNSYVSAQLGTNARHTANSLGLSIKSIGDIEDITIIESMISSIFDSGYYSLIKFSDVDGNVLVESKQPTSVNGVPEWFVKNIHLNAPVESSEVMIGWSKAGTVYVQSNVGIAYYELYRILKSIFIVMLAISLVALLLGYFGLKAIFMPLKKVQYQAEAVLENRFILQEKIPLTLDIRYIVSAMNSMISKVKDVFEQSAKTLGKYEELLYKDEQTGLFNRRYFQNKFIEFLSSEEDSSGSVMLFSCKDLRLLKGDLGFEKWQNLVVEISQILSKNSQDMLCARLNDDDFVIVEPRLNRDKILAIGSEILSQSKAVFEKFGIEESRCLVNASIVSYSCESNLKSVLISSDVTLSKARQQGNFSLKINDGESGILLGKEQYKDLIEASLKNKMFKFASQKVLSSSGELVHNELFLRLVDKDGKWQMASYFMPMVNELNLATKIDFYVLEKVADMLASKSLPSGAISINLGKEAVSSTHNFAMIEAILKRIKQHTQDKIFIEIPNKDDINLTAVLKLQQKLKELKFGLGLDHFGFDSKSIERLKEISPDYVKIPARNLIDFLGDNASEQKHSFDMIMRSKEIEIISIIVEDLEQKEKLKSLGVNSMQGIYISSVENIG